MRRLPFIIIILLVAANIIILASVNLQSPHGKKLNYGCDECHSSEGWFMDPNSKFDHSSTQFKLSGQHTGVGCKACHPTLVFNEAENQCVSCHTDIHKETVGLDCDRCHTSYTWQVTNIFEIHTLGRFPLVGPHAAADCQSCHKEASALEFSPIDPSCRTCHIENYLATTRPNHQQAGYSTSCEECHNIYSYEWSSTGINHNFFPLVGGHDVADCAACHKSQDYGAISPDCYSCHESDYNSTVNPAHLDAGFSTNCISCHSYETGWIPASFDHNIFFPLTGVHQISECQRCHSSGNYSDASSVCYSCHQPDYESTSDPDHSVNNFSTQCEECHITSGPWSPSTFDHSKYFALTGVHNIDNCKACHLSGIYSDASSECYSCHEKDYLSTTDPNHGLLGFSTNCVLCHTLDGWTPSTFDHSGYFPIYTGRHSNQWNSCADCHINPGNFSLFSCIDCHKHNRTETDSHHGEIADYVYESTACLNCHPLGEAD